MWVFMGLSGECQSVPLRTTLEKGHFTGEQAWYIKKENVPLGLWGKEHGQDGEKDGQAGAGNRRTGTPFLNIISYSGAGRRGRKRANFGLNLQFIGDRRDIVSSIGIVIRHKSSLYTQTPIVQLVKALCWKTPSLVSFQLKESSPRNRGRNWRLGALGTPDEAGEQKIALLKYLNSC